MTAEYNGEVDWGKFNPEVYAARQYGRPSEADIRIAAGIIAVLAELPGGYDSFTEIGACGVLRTACLAAPILARDARITLTDTAEPQLEQTRQELRRAQNGERTMWHEHAAHMAQANGRWSGALARLSGNPNIAVREHDITTTKLGGAAVRAEAHCLCSITSDAGQQEHAFDNFIAGMEPGDVAIRLFDVGSTGYWVGGLRFPGHPIDPDTVARQAKSRGLEAPAAFAVQANQPSAEGTGSTFSALGGAVLLKPRTRTALDLKALTKSPDS